MTTQNAPSSLSMLQQISAKLGKTLGVGGSASFAVLKADQTPADLSLEYVLDETEQIQALAKAGHGQHATARLTALKRVVDIAILAEQRLNKANQLAQVHTFKHPAQIDPKIVPATGAGPLATKSAQPQAKTAPAAEPEADALDQTLAELAQIAGEPAAELVEETEELEVVEPEAAAPVDAAPAEGEPVQKSYPIGPDGLAQDGKVEWPTDLSAARREELKKSQKKGESEPPVRHDDPKDARRTFRPVRA